jgi:hypothetical protein
MTMNEHDIFRAALELDSQVDRAAYLEQACAGDAALRQHLEEEGLLRK